MAALAQQQARLRELLCGADDTALARLSVFVNRGPCTSVKLSAAVRGNIPNLSTIDTAPVIALQLHRGSLWSTSEMVPPPIASVESGTPSNFFRHLPYREMDG